MRDCHQTIIDTQNDNNCDDGELSLVVRPHFAQGDLADRSSINVEMRVFVHARGLSRYCSRFTTTSTGCSRYHTFVCDASAGSISTSDRSGSIIARSRERHLSLTRSCINIEWKPERSGFVAARSDFDVVS